MEKIKVIIIDDEMLIRKLIRMKMDTVSLGVEIVGEYSNSFSALEGVRELKPDIVISDICMPEEDGIVFSEKCLKIMPEAKIIILTGYNDFDYARRSIKAGVFDYLMKPIQREELNATIKKAADQIREARQKKKMEEKFREEIQNNLPILREHFLNQIMTQETNEVDLESRLKSYGIEINTSEDAYVQIAILVTSEMLQNPVLAEKICQEARAFFESEKYISILSDSWKRIIIVNNNTEIPFHECVDLLIQLLETKTGGQLRSGISKEYSSWKNLHKAYEEAIGSLQNQYISGRIYLEEVSELQRTEWKDMLEHIYQGNISRVCSYIEVLLDPLSELVTENERKKIKSTIQKICIDLDLNVKDLWTYALEKYCTYKDDYFRWIHLCAVEIILNRVSEKEPGKVILMKEILTYMNKNLSTVEMGVNLLSNKYGVSASYLSKLFKNYTSRTCGELLSELRFWKMKELMEETGLRDKEIGERIGIPDAHYLSIWFRKLTGYSVTEYKKRKKQLRK